MNKSQHESLDIFQRCTILMSFEKYWSNILVHEGENFKTIFDLDFSYKIDKTILIPSRTEYNISKSDFHKAFDRLPLKGPGEISDLVRGPSYIWAILNDQRIKSKGYFEKSTSLL